MAKYRMEEIGKIYRTRKVKTFGDKVKEFFEMVAGAISIIVVIVIIVAIIT